jgi:hypothetical protein
MKHAERTQEQLLFEAWAEDAAGGLKNSFGTPT